MAIDPISEGQRQQYKEQYGEEHPQPKEPDIMPGNVEAIWIWQMVENQVIELHSGHILGVKIPVVIDLCGKLKIKGDKLFETLDKIKFIERMGAYSWLKRIKKEEKRKGR